MAAAAAGLEAISAQADPTPAGTPSGANAASAAADEPAKRHWAAPYYDAAVGAGWFGAHQIDELQLAGRERMRARDFLNGNKNIENYIIK